MKTEFIPIIKLLGKLPLNTSSINPFTYYLLILCFIL